MLGLSLYCGYCYAVKSCLMYTVTNPLIGCLHSKRRYCLQAMKFINTGDIIVSGEEQNRGATFINSVDQKTHDSILLLDRKLKGLLSEIQTKKESIVHVNDAATLEQKKNLTVLYEEITRALAGMDALVNMVVGDEATAKRVKESNPLQMTELCQVLIEGAQKITEIEEKL